jgi:hypothetical protein
MDYFLKTNLSKDEQYIGMANNWNTSVYIQDNQNENPNHWRNVAMKKHTSRLILFWGNWFEQAPDFIVDDCPLMCELTTDKSRIYDATVVVFNSRVKAGWPDVRFQNQTYVHCLSERPGPWQHWLAEYDGKINLTCNYRHDADISTRRILQFDNSSMIEEYVPRIPLAKKSMAVAWMVSHCNASSRRDEYVKELAKYIDVDAYGACSLRSCPKENDSLCLDLFESNYKFYLGFENRICKDYITEKFYKPLQHELIPVVLGGGDYKTAAPPHSYINVQDFESPRALAQYLHHLSHNENDYYAYFKWKSRYKITSMENDASCTLCNIAHNSSWSRPAHTDYYNWWFSGCDDSLVDTMRAEGNW